MSRSQEEIKDRPTRRSIFSDQRLESQSNIEIVSDYVCDLNRVIVDQIDNETESIGTVTEKSE